METVAHNLVTLTICFSQRLLRLANISFYTSIYLNLQKPPISLCNTQPSQDKFPGNIGGKK